mmetsp:Transcript_5624/g.13589  ORF Transcript_5624/g.13589 Transcript_5624/m.13589 type:complete len:336 (-) Transcript_5624:62-1069(-)
MSEHVFQNGSQPARGLLREPQQRHVEIHREPVAQHGLDKRAENLDVDHPGKNLPEGGVGPSHEGGPLVLRVLEQPAVLVRVALGLLGVVLVLAHGEALLSAARLELIQLLLEQRHAVEMKVVILRKLLPALRHDHRSQGLVAAQKLPLFEFRDDHEGGHQVLRVDDVLGLDDRRERLPHEVPLAAPLDHRERLLGVGVIREADFEVFLETGDFFDDVALDFLDVIGARKLGFVPFEVAQVLLDGFPLDERDDVLIRLELAELSQNPPHRGFHVAIILRELIAHPQQGIQGADAEAREGEAGDGGEAVLVLDEGLHALEGGSALLHGLVGRGDHPE